MTRDLPTVAVVIPTAGERPGTLAGLIDAVLSDRATTQVIVVLDQESSATERLVLDRAQRDPRLALVRTDPPAYPERDRGQASRDVGFRLAEAEILLSLDDDLEPKPGLVSGHAERHRDRASIVVLGYAPVVPADPEPDDSQAAARLYSRVYEESCRHFRDGSSEVLLGLWGGHFSVRRIDWLSTERKAAAGRDGSMSIGAHHIDTALGFRLREYGLEGIFDPDLVAAHRYRRALRHVSDAAHSVAYGRTLLQAAYPALVRPPEEGRDTWRSLGVALRLSRSQLLTNAASKSALALGLAAARLRLGSVEFVSARVLAAIGYAIGIRDARADLSSRA